MLGKLTEPEPYFLMRAAWLTLQQTGNSGRSGMSLRPHMEMRTPSKKCFALVDLCLHPFLRRTTIQGCQDQMCSPQQVRTCFSLSYLAFAILDRPSWTFHLKFFEKTEQLIVFDGSYLHASMAVSLLLCEHLLQKISQCWISSVARSAFDRYHTCSPAISSRVSASRSFERVWHKTDMK